MMPDDLPGHVMDWQQPDHHHVDPDRHQVDPDPNRAELDPDRPPQDHQGRTGPEPFDPYH